MSKFHSLLFIALLSFPQLCFAQSKDAPKASESAAPAATDPKAADVPQSTPQQAESKEGKESPMLLQITRASDLTINIRTQIDQIDQKLEILEKPTPSLIGLIEARRQTLLEQLAKLDQSALELARLEEEFRAALVADYQFTGITPEQRTQYLTDGMVIYDAMMKGFEESSISRQIDGLNYFETLNDNFQGIPNYAKAQDLYYKTLEKLIKQWTRLKEIEDRKRSRMTENRLKQLKEREDKLLEELGEKLKEDDIRSAMTERWIPPYKKSYFMLTSILSRAESTLRNRSTKGPDKDELPAEGGVVSMLEQVWLELDAVRQKMCAGHYDEAQEMLTENENYRKLLRLNRYILPEKYRAPVVEQYAALRNENMKRQRAHRSREIDLTRRINTLQRSVDSCEAQIKAIYREIDRAKENEDRRKKLDEDRKRLEEERREAREKARQQRELDAGKKPS